MGDLAHMVPGLVAGSTQGQIGIRWQIRWLQELLWDVSLRVFPAIRRAARVSLRM